MVQKSAVGIDACPGGWIAARAGDAGDVEFSLHADIAGCWRGNRGAALQLIDIPIGLGSGRRACDMAAKRLLGRHNSRVFLTPPRRSVEAGGYAEANTISREQCGLGVSKQCWNILPKVRQVDAFLAATPEARGVLRECHPEVCLAALNSENAEPRPIAANKKSDEGAEIRMTLIAGHLPGAPAALRIALTAFPKGSVARDDLVDALAALVTALGIMREPDSLRTLPESPPLDERGLAMEMVYWSPGRSHLSRATSIAAPQPVSATPMQPLPRAARKRT